MFTEKRQMFGECIAIWILLEWKKMGKPQPLKLVELGPGHGTLMQDILKTINKISPDELKHLQIHLVETSPNLMKIQDSRLKIFQEKIEADIKWHSRVAEVPKGK